MIPDAFRPKAHGINGRTEVIAGATTWVTMVYIAAVNPQILQQAGMDFGAAFMATCLAAAFACFLMGGYANLPIALAPGMGLNAFFTFSVVKGMGLPWQQALGAVFWSGMICVVISITPLREMLIKGMPRSIKTGIAIGIGLFLAVIGLGNAGIVVRGQGTLTTIGDIRSWSAGLTLLGFVVIAALHARGKNVAVIAGILITAGIAWAFDPSAHMPTSWLAFPPSITPSLLQLDFAVRWDIAFVALIMSLVFVDLFDTSGTLVAVASKAESLQEPGGSENAGNIRNLRQAMIADSAASPIGALLGTSSTTSYIESSAGIAAGGRTGLTAIVVGLLFLLTLVVSPLAAAIPVYATAPALIFVAVLLIGALSDFSAWDDFTESAPLIVTAIMMPLAFSIADGIAAGVLVYVAVKLIGGRAKDISPMMAALGVLFALRFALLDTH